VWAQSICFKSFLESELLFIIQLYICGRCTAAGLDSIIVGIMSVQKPLPPFVKPPKKEYPTRFVFISNADTNSETLEDELIQNFHTFGDLDYDCGPIFINYKRVGVDVL
jgi:hypothetical protein